MAELDEMLQSLKENFGIAEEEQVTENSYRFKNRNKQMQEDYLFVDAVENKSERMYVKDKLGFDR